MITVERTDAIDLLREMVADPSVYRSMADDASPAAEALPLDRLQGIGARLYNVLKDGLGVGVFVLFPKPDDAWEAHTVLGPKCRGKDAVVAARLFLQRAFADGAKLITSYAFSDAPAVKWFCRVMGLRETGSAEHANTRNGQPVRVHFYAISNPNLLSPCP